VKDTDYIVGRGGGDREMRRKVWKMRMGRWEKE
jgi:hypothetical protein